jgi:poly-gamma-glutamate synthesis protein (capsule biosynthesis protein)
LTGDSILQRRLLARTDPVLQPLCDLIRGADVAFTNLEVLANDYRGDPAVESGGSHFGAPAWVLDELVEAGFGLFATATNHCGDYGIAGLLHTIDALDGRGLSYAGIGRHLEAARRPAYHGHPNGTVALLSCCTTFAKGQEAGLQSADMQGRPGLNPLRFDTVHEVTAPQLAALKEIAEQVGLEGLRQQTLRAGFGFAPDDPAVFPLGSLNFRQGDKPGIRMTAKRKDLDAILRWVGEARALADVVMVSIHSHEQGATKEDPPEFLPRVARAFIEGGADLVVCHGPHLLRGMEVVDNRPIFYSLGNFIGQNELVPRIPADGYERFRADPALTPGAVYRQRTNDDRAGFPADRRYWESVLPILSFEGGRLAGITIHPLSLGFGEPRHLRGRPRLARGKEAAAILSRFAALSEPFGAGLAIGEGVATCVRRAA